MSKEEELAGNACRNAAADKSGVNAQHFSISEVLFSEAGTSVRLKNDRSGDKWSCMVDGKGHVQGVAKSQF
tara:strand:+ start:292 stop:504 length:213 start_codon:yes stop_codon:yes gene_type:complete